MIDESGEIANSTDRFPEALRHLLEVRKMSYRRLATRTRLSAGYLNHLASGTRKVPSNQVIKILSKALRVKPDYFLEYRQRLLQAELEKAPDLVDALYDQLVTQKVPPRELRARIGLAPKTT